MFMPLDTFGASFSGLQKTVIHQLTYPPHVFQFLSKPTCFLLFLFTNDHLLYIYVYVVYYNSYYTSTVCTILIYLHLFMNVLFP